MAELAPGGGVPPPPGRAHSSSAQAKIANLPRPIKPVHLIQSNHLDVGYTSAVRVINTYFDDFFPQAIKIGKGYLNCPLDWRSDASSINILHYIDRSRKEVCRNALR
jgi:hypothetical protein